MNIALKYLTYTFIKMNNRKRMNPKNAFLFLTGFVCLFFLGISCQKNSTVTPVRVVEELNVGESAEVELTNGERVNLKLLQVDVKRDSLYNAIRDVQVKVSVDGEVITLQSGNYNLPVPVGKVKIDCPAVINYYSNTNQDRWGLEKDARFRLWPKDSPYIRSEDFAYPIKQSWFATLSQSGNEPVHVNHYSAYDGGVIYYHDGHDFGGAEGLEEIVSATDGVVMTTNRKGVVIIEDERGWHHHYIHLDSIDPAIELGKKVKMGQRLGFIGKQDGSGGWVHLHYGIKINDPYTDKWQIEDAYVYLWESYVRQYKPDMIAVARPHLLLGTGQEATLDGTKSRSFSGDIVSYEWQYCDGNTARGAVQTKIYRKPGTYSEILKVTDSEGNIDYDFQVVIVVDRDKTEKVIPTIQPAYFPTLNIQPGEPVRFFARTFGTDYGEETWDFGDGTGKVTTRSEFDKKNATEGKFAETLHTFSEPGDYLVKVERSNEDDVKAIAHLHVVVEDK